MNSPRIRIFGTHDCAKCKQVVSVLNSCKLPHIFVDANADDDSIQDLCDLNSVTDLPHVQLLADEEKVVANYVRDVDSRQLIDHYLKLLKG